MSRSIVQEALYGSPGGACRTGWRNGCRAVPPSRAGTSSRRQAVDRGPVGGPGTARRAGGGRAVGHRVRVLVGLWAVAEVVVFVLLAAWIGRGLDAAGRDRDHCPGLGAAGPAGHSGAGRAAAAGPPATSGRTGHGGRRPDRRRWVLMVLPGFLGDVVGLLCLLPPTRFLVRGLLGRAVTSRLPVELRGPVRVRSAAPRGCRTRAVRSARAPTRRGWGRPLVHRGRGRPRGAPTRRSDLTTGSLPAGWARPRVAPAGPP
jgi:UPF0716 protein FxsA